MMHSIHNITCVGGILDGLQQLCLVYAVSYHDGVPVLDRYENDGIHPDVLADMGTLLASWRNIMKVRTSY